MHASSAPSHHVHSSPAAVAPTGRAASALCAPLYSSCCNPRHRRVERDVQQRPAAAQHRSSSLYAPAAHRSRAHEIRRHQVHAMLWDGRQEGLAAAREWPLRLPRRMVPKMRVDRGPSTSVSFFLFSLAFRTRRVRTLTATALPDRLGPFSCARTDVVAVHNFLSAHVEQCAQPPALHPRRSDADPTAVTSFVRSRTPWCGPSQSRVQESVNLRPPLRSTVLVVELTFERRRTQGT